MTAAKNQNKAAVQLANATPMLRNGESKWTTKSQGKLDVSLAGSE